MHRNPVERQLSSGRSFAPEGMAGSASLTGTNDLLLYRDIAQALVRSCFQTNELLSDPDVLVVRLREERDEQGYSIFDALGNRSGKGGEYITLLRPVFEGLQLLPRSLIEVYNRDPSTQQWKRIESLFAEYGNVDNKAGTVRRGP
jgi:hypothetical protein